MTEWHIDPVYITENWTEEMLGVMVDKLVERKQRELNTLAGKHQGSEYVSPETLAQVSRGSIKVVKRGN